MKLMFKPISFLRVSHFNILFFIFILNLPIIYSQSLGLSGPPQLVVYQNPPQTTLSNNRYTVKVRQGAGPWQDLFEYLTYVNSGIGKEVFSPSSFVHFDFSGTVEIEVTLNSSLEFINSAKIRPISKNITPNIQIGSKKVRFFISTPVNLSLEINNDRYKNLHIFANPLDPGPPAGATRVADMNNPNNPKLTNRPLVNNCLEKLWYKPSNGETIYIGGHEVFDKSIWLDNVSDVTIIGRGVIDFTNPNYPKNYLDINPPNYCYLSGIDIEKNSSNIKIDGIVINDPQHRPIIIYQSDTITINNVKAISRVRWGDGIHMVATNNVTIENCFLRTSDDAIAIYPARVNYWGGPSSPPTIYDGNARNISVKNTSLYADVAKAIQIGGHGLYDLIPERAVVENVSFEKIDILEHDEYWAPAYGSISINCADYNYCQFISFKDINVEDFTNGSLLNVKIEPAPSTGPGASGYRIHNITFENLTYNCSPCEEEISYIGGINSCKYVSGVHFKNFKINNQVITSAGLYPKLNINSYAYDVTFNQNLNFVHLNNGTYSLVNRGNDKSLDKTVQIFDDGDGDPNNNDPDKHYTVTSPWGGEWILEEIDGEPNTYSLRSTYYNPTGTGYLTRSDQGKYYGPTGDCYDYYLITQPWEDLGNQKWRIVPITSHYYRIIGAYDYNYSLSVTPIPYVNDPQNFYTMALPWKTQPNGYTQQWEIIASTPKPFESNTTNVKLDNINFQVYPNPTRETLNVKQLDFDENLNFRIMDVQGRTVIINNLNEKEQQVNISQLENGLYFIFIEKQNKSIFTSKFLKI